MPTNHNETLAERYMRELQTELAIYSRMTPEQIGAMAVDLHNALAERDAALAELATVKKVAYGNLELLDETELLKAELAALKGGQEPVAMLRYARGVPGFENEMPHVVSCNDLPDGLYPVYLAPPAQASAWVEATEAMVMAARGVCVSFRGHYGEHNDYLDDCTARQILRAAMLAAPTPGASDGKGGDV